MKKCLGKRLNVSIYAVADLRPVGPTRQTLNIIRYSRMIDKRPEAQIISTIKEKGDLESFANFWGCTREDVDDALEKALLAPTHAEFYTLSQNVYVSIESIKLDLFRAYKSICSDEVDCISKKISDMLATL